MKKLLLFGVFMFFLPVVSFAETVNFATSYDNAHTTGNTTVQQYAIQFTTTAAATDAVVSGHIYKLGSPSDNFVMKIVADNSAAPTGATIGTATQAFSGISGTSSADCPTATTMTFSGMTMPAGTYWLVYTRSGAVSDTDRYARCDLDAYTTYTDDTYNGSSWSAVSGVGNVYASIVLSSAAAPAVPIGGATSTIEQSQQNLSYALLLFFFVFFGVVWLLGKSK